MKDPLTRLTEKTVTLGNYNRKYLHIISSNIEKLTVALEQQGVRDQVHLWSYSMEIPGEMDTVLQASATKERLDFLGCYFALQFLHMNLRTVDIVKLELATSPNRSQTGKKLMLEAGRMFRYLTKCYMERLLGIFLQEVQTPEYVMLGVGTRADQDDIDLGIIHRQPGDAEALNRAIARLSNQMFKKATRLHFHLSEHVGENSFTATIEQYEEMLDKEAYDFVIVTEMLGAATILGSYSLYEQFRKRVTSRFYFDPKRKENRYHEGYLRGILGEVNALLTRVKPRDTINPKDDILRPIKALLSALKLVYGVDRVNAWQIIEELREKNSSRQAQYDDLERTLSFFELFRHLYQIMVAQDEDICLAEPGVEKMVAKIAEMIGFEKKGVVSAKDFLLVIYYEFLENSMESIEVLTDDLKKHLHEVSVCTPIFSGEIYTRPGYKGNLAVDFIRASTFSKGITYWDDFLEELSGKDNVFYNEYIQSFLQLPERVRVKVANGYVNGAKYDPASTMRFLVILGEKAKEDDAKEVFNRMSSLFIDVISRLPGVSASLAQLLYAHPGDLNRFLAQLNWDCLARFTRLAQSQSTLPEPSTVQKQLVALTDVHYQSSHFFKWHFHQILNKYPIYIRNLHNNAKLCEITSGFYSDLTSLASINERIERLGDYYDLEFVRVSLLAMAGADSEQTDLEFTEFCDNYTHALFEFCQQDLHLSLGYSMHTRDMFALYATGGHAREQGFDDDYDMIVILDSTDPEEIDYCNKIVGKMNSHILKRGILPHHRFADLFGSYVMSFDQLAEHLSTAGEEVFVDQSQLLNSRMLVGSRKLEAKFQEEIIGRQIFARGQEYLEHMRAEMESRHSGENGEIQNDIKECGGGLRDIEMFLLMYETKYKVREPLSRKFLRRLVELEPENAEHFIYIEKHLDFIKNLRDLYRLKVAAHNVIDPDFLPPVAASFGYGDSTEAGKKLFREFLDRTAQAAAIINLLINKISI